METEESKLGHTAYDAYCQTTNWKSAITGADLPPFEETPEAVQAGWIAAAKAAVKASKVRSSLAGLIGASTMEELKQMELAVRVTPAPELDRIVAMNAIHALLESD